MTDYPRCARPEQVGYSFDMRPDNEAIPGRDDLDPDESHARPYRAVAREQGSDSMNRMSWHERTCMCACFLMLGFLAWAIPNQAVFAGFVMGLLP